MRKPGAFARYRFREQMFPTMTFRLAYDALKRWRGERADVEYVRMLHLAATTMESTVDSALALLLEAGEPFDYATVKELAHVNGGVKVGRVGGRLLSIGDQILYRPPSFIGL